MHFAKSKMNFSDKISDSERENLFLKSCKEVDSWFLMSAPWPVLSIVAFYLLFVVKLGPELMIKRKPLKIKPIIMVYNLFQSAFNAYIVSTIFLADGAITYVWNHSCHPIDPSVNHLYNTLNSSSWWFFFSKVMDLLDTVFFTLRKKKSHITFLHVYHHANMVLSSWVYLKYIKGEQVAVIGVLNAFVHVIMYTYYFLAALGPEVKKYLWWKKYITKIQMLQFIIIIIFMSSLLIRKCQVPKLLSLFAIFQGITFFILFANFYTKTYVIPEKSKTK